MIWWYNLGSKIQTSEKRPKIMNYKIKIKKLVQVVEVEKSHLIKEYNKCKENLLNRLLQRL